MVSVNVLISEAFIVAPHVLSFSWDLDLLFVDKVSPIIFYQAKLIGIRAKIKKKGHDFVSVNLR